MENRDFISELKEEISCYLYDRRDISDEEILELIDEKLEALEHTHYLSMMKKLKIRKEIFSAFRKLDLLQELLDDASITEIMINGKDNIFVEKSGNIMKLDKSFHSEEQLEDMIQKIVSQINRIVNTKNPIVDARLADGSRVHIVLPPVALSGATVTIRKFPEILEMDRLIAYQAVSKEAAAVLEKLVLAKYNIFISGGTNSGKTTFLNALSSYIPKDERVITIEDSAELQLYQIKNLVKLEARNANMEGEGRVSIAELIKASLRMNPDRIIIGEVRAEEALDMLQAMNTGHDGSLSTGHGNSPRDMLSRLETMVLRGADLPLPAIQSQIASALDIMIHLGRLRDRSRRVLSIVEVCGYNNNEIELNPLYEFVEDHAKSTKERVVGGLVQVGELRNREKLSLAGY